MPLTYDYATLRVVPRVDRSEFVNVGVVVFCLEQKKLLSRTEVDERRLCVLWDEVDIFAAWDHLQAIESICRGEPDAGPIARLSVRERFHWIVAPRSTMVQASPVHTGFCSSPEQALQDLFRRLVE